jgi:GT2 family glycosyltransferase
MIWNFVPYCPLNEGAEGVVGKDLGTMYNRYIEPVPAGDWACFLDHDVMQTTRYWYRLLEQATKALPDAGVFVAATNRLNPLRSAWQMAGEALETCDDITVHWQEGHARYSKYGAEVVDVTDIEDSSSLVVPLSGTAFCVSVDAWRAVGGAPSGFTQVDWRIHRRMREGGYRVYLLPGWYVYHWFRRIPEFL